MEIRIEPELWGQACTALLERVNKALAEIIADGTYQKITEKYFPFKLLSD